MEELILTGDEVIAKLVSGTNKLADIVKVTMGPRGKNVIIRTLKGDPKVTKDGVSVAREVVLVDPYENLAADLLKEVANNTVNSVGDGTTSSIVIAQALINSGCKVENITQFKLGMNKAQKDISSKLTSSSISVDDKDVLRNIALTSSNGDTEAADIITDLALTVGKHGAMNVVKSELTHTKSIIVNGYRYKKGIVSSSFINSVDTSSYAEKNCLVILISSEVDKFNQLTKLMVKANDLKRPLVIIAKEFKEEVINTLYKNVKAGVKVIPVIAPGFGDNQKQAMEDIAIYTGSKVVNKAELASIDYKPSFGVCDSVDVGIEYTTILNSTQTVAVSERVERLKSLMGSALNPLDRTRLLERVRQLTESLGIILVGGQSSAEIDELFDRYEDAVGAVTSAYNLGVLPGAGMSLYNVSLDLCKESVVGTAAFKTGYAVLIEAIKQPARQIAINGDIVIKDSDFESPRYGYDMVNLEIVDLINKGILDPIAVTISAINSAVSVSTLILSTGGIIAK